MIRIGILGAARIARALLKEKPFNAEFVAIASRDEAKAKNFAEEFHIPKIFGNYESLLKDDTIEAVYIPLPHHLHAEYTIRSAEAGKHILCEKPAALSVQEAEAMAEACEKHNVFFMEAFMYRFFSIHQRVRERIRAEVIGKLRYIDFQFCIFSKPYMEGTFRWEKSLGGGALFDLGIYGIDLSRWMTGKEPEVLSVEIFRDHPNAVDEFGKLLLRLGDVFSSVTSSYITYHCAYTLSGENGSIHVPTGVIGKSMRTKLILKTHDHELEEELFEPENAYKKEVEYFAECIRRKRKPELDLANCLANLRVLEKALKLEKPIHLT